MEKIHLVVLGAVSASIIVLTVIFGPALTSHIPKNLSVFNLPSDVTRAYNISTDSVAFYAVWGFIGTFIALGVDVAAVTLVISEKR